MTRTTQLRRRMTILAAGILAASAAVAAPAQAAPPANDSIARATVVTSVPSTFTQQTSEATAQRSDGDCVKGSSVWFRYRPQADITARVSTVGSDYDTTLAIFTGPRDNRRLISCSDDSAGYNEAVQVDFVKDRRYWVAVSACCRRSSVGGKAVVSFTRPAPAGAKLTVDEVARGTISGRLFITGTLSCNTPSLLYMEAKVSQLVANHVARGYGAVETSCTKQTTPWRLALDSETGWAFQDGGASVEWVYEVFDGFGYVSGDDERIVTIGSTPARPKS